VRVIAVPAWLGDPGCRIERDRAPPKRRGRGWNIALEEPASACGADEFAAFRDDLARGIRPWQNGAERAW